MLDPARHDEDLACLELDVAVPQMDRQPAAEHQKEIIGLVVLVPHERPHDLDYLELVVIEETDDARLVGFLEERQLRSNVDLVVHSGDVYQQWGTRGAAPAPSVRLLRRRRRSRTP